MTRDVNYIQLMKGQAFISVATKTVINPSKTKRRLL
jgi:hypothetical protein